MAFGIGTNTGHPEHKALSAGTTEVAVKCWFTSTGKSMPLMTIFSISFAVSSSTQYLPHMRLLLLCNYSSTSFQKHSSGWNKRVNSTHCPSASARQRYFQFKMPAYHCLSEVRTWMWSTVMISPSPVRSLVSWTSV